MQAAATIGIAWGTATAIARAVDGAPTELLAAPLAALAGSVLVRAACAWAMDAAGAAASARVKGQLRSAALAAVVRIGPAGTRGRSSAALATLLGTGLDALDGYFGRFLPQLLLTAVATPVLVLAMLVADPLSGVIVVIVLPLIPVFMVLVGWATQAVQRRQWDRLQQLGAAFVDTVGGLSTLKVFGRAARQPARIAGVAEQYRTETMRVLRVSFLSGFVLELAGSLSVALVAVEVGLRLLDGGMALGAGLFVLLLAPDAFLPVRAVGAQYHAAADGLAAAVDVLDLLDEDAARPASVRTREGVRLEGVSVRYGEPAVVENLTLTMEPGTITAVTGPSGSGKSSLLRAIAGLQPADGLIAAGPTAWVPQAPGLRAGTVAANVALGDAEASRALVTECLAAVDLALLNPDLVLGEAGSGLSGGQAQRVALARALYRLRRAKATVLVADEPTSALDADTERIVIDALRLAAAAGATVVVASHRLALVAAADALLSLDREAAHV